MSKRTHKACTELANSKLTATEIRRAKHEQRKARNATRKAERIAEAAERQAAWDSLSLRDKIACLDSRPGRCLKQRVAIFEQLLKEECAKQEKQSKPKAAKKSKSK